MPKIIKLFGVVVLVCLSLLGFTGEQMGVATVSENNCISLDDDSTLFDTYFIDISNLEFTSSVEAEKNFRFISSNLVRFEVDFSNNRVTMFLLKKNLVKKSWSKSDWNNYFISRCKN